MQFMWMTDNTFDHVEHLVELGTVGYAAWRVVSATNRILDMLKDFPLHRHVNGKILFPKGYSPPAIETLKEARSGD
jgi:hypothetical protein